MDKNVINSWRGVGLLTYLLGYREGGQEEMLDYIECLGEDLQGPLAAIQVSLVKKAGPQLSSAGADIAELSHMSPVTCLLEPSSVLYCDPSPTDVFSKLCAVRLECEVQR